MLEVKRISLVPDLEAVLIRQKSALSVGFQRERNNPKLTNEIIFDFLIEIQEIIKKVIIPIPSQKSDHNKRWYV